MKTNLVMALGLVLALFMVNPTIVSGVTYSDIDLKLNPSTVSVCPCVPITPQHVRISVKNLGADPVIPQFEITQLPSGWSGQIQNYLDKSLAPGEEGQIDLLLINPPSCTIAPGTYDVKIRATGLSANDYDEETLHIEIMQCYGVEMIPNIAQKDTCMESGEPVEFPVTIRNLGKIKETFYLSTNVNWASMKQSSVILNPGETRTVNMVADVPAGLIGMQTVSLQAVSTTNPNTKDTTQVKLQVNDCYGFEADLIPQGNTVCLTKSVVYKLLIKNTGLRSDTYQIYGPAWVEILDKEISLQKGAAKEITIIATPTQTGTVPLQLSVVPSADPSDAETVSGSITANECRSVAVVVSPSEDDVCRGLDTELTVTIKNLGVIEDAFDLNTNRGSLSQNKVIIGPDGQKQVKLTVDTQALNEGEYGITVTASDGVVSDTSEATILVKDCYGATIEIVPAEQTKCVCDVAEYEIVLKNTGELADTYDVSFTSNLKDMAKQVELEAGTETTIPVSVPTLGAEAGNYTLTATAVSEHVSVSANAALNLKSFNTCYALMIKLGEETIVVESCTAETVPINIKNTGERADTFQISYEGPQWIYIAPDSVTLNSGEEKEIYLYVSPPYEVTSGDFTADIEIAGRSRADVDVEIKVTPNENATATTGGQNATSGDTDEDNETGIVINVTTGGTGANITGAITGDEERPAWKTIVVAIITVIIVLILIIRFALLIRK